MIVGKTNLHELAIGVTSANAAFGAVRSALDPDLVAGGSSGGTGAAIGCGLLLDGLPHGDDALLSLAEHLSGPLTGMLAGDHSLRATPP